jgi:hypothetical protein
LSRTHSISVGEDGEVVSLDVHETQDYVLPPVHHEEPEESLEAVAVDCVGCVDCTEHNVVEESLEGGDGGSLVEEERREGVGSSDAESKNLSEVLLALDLKQRDGHTQ